MLTTSVRQALQSYICCMIKTILSYNITYISCIFVCSNCLLILVQGKYDVSCLLIEHFKCMKMKSAMHFSHPAEKSCLVTKKSPSAWGKNDSNPDMKHMI